ncbi:MAG: CDP-diacylglycerol--glycerol-3-phosphate 3-phosphatidyltransferase [Pseudomonadota bacterium]
MKLELRYLPTSLTLFRIAIIPLLVVAYYLPWGHITSVILFAVACITDWFDGYLARSLNLSTSFGAFLDPVADKLLVVAALILVIKRFDYLVVPGMIIIGREVLISALREWLAKINDKTRIAVSYTAKVKTTVQMFAIVFLLASPPDSYLWLRVIGYILLYMAMALTLWTMLMYIKMSWNQFRKSM